MALTLLEAAKLTDDLLTVAIVEEYARSSDILRVLPFMDIQGNALRYNREDTLPGIGFRGINQAYDESTGILNPQTEALTIAGGDLDVDTFIIKTMGESQRAIQETMKVKSLSLAWTKNFIKGDSSVNPAVFDGLQRRVTGTQLIANASGSGGGALSLNKLDELIDAVDMPTHLIMNKAMRRRLSAASRNTGVGGYITYGIDEFGRKVSQYQDLPILVMDYDNNGDNIMPFNEADGTGSAASTTSIYCVSLENNMLTGIQNGTVDVRDLGELETAPKMRTRVEWYSGICVMHGRSAARLAYITDAAVTA